MTEKNYTIHSDANPSVSEPPSDQGHATIAEQVMQNNSSDINAAHYSEEMPFASANDGHETAVGGQTINSPLPDDFDPAVGQVVDRDIDKVVNSDFHQSFGRSFDQSLESPPTQATTSVHHVPEAFYEPSPMEHPELVENSTAHLSNARASNPFPGLSGSGLASNENSHQSSANIPHKNAELNSANHHDDMANADNEASDLDAASKIDLPQTSRREADDMQHLKETNNAYAEAYQNNLSDEFEQDIPVIDQPAGTGVNKKALAFVGLMSCMVLGGGLWALSKISGGDDKAPVTAEVSAPTEAPPLDIVIPGSTELPTPTDEILNPTDPTKTDVKKADLANTTTGTQPTSPPVVFTPPPPTNAPVEIARRPEPDYSPTPKPDRTTAVLPKTPVDPGPLVSVSSTDRTTSAPMLVNELASTGSVQKINDMSNWMLQGTILRCTLETRIVSDIPGPSSCVLSQNVYSANGKKLLIEKGSKAQGKFSSSLGGDRIGVIWSRIITPSGLVVNLDSPGVGLQGDSGVKGDYRSHWMTRIGSALLISLMSDGVNMATANIEKLKSTTTDTTSDTTTSPLYESNTSKTLQASAAEEIKRLGQRAPTVTINQGTLLNIYVNKDFNFENIR